MRLIIITILVLLLVGCRTTEYVYDGYTVSITDKGKITVQGKALDAKAGAIVETEESEIYYVDGYSHWEQNFYGKQIEVSGRLRIRETTLTDTVIIQYAPRMDIIVDPVVKLIEEMN